MTKNSIGICHYRIGKTDGVSLEIKKRKKLLEEMGYTVKLIAGPVQEGSDFIIPQLEFDTPEILKIRHNAFEKFEDFKNDSEFETYINEVANSIKQQFLKINEKENFDYLFIHNIFTHGRHIASAKAFYEIALESDIKVISVNHDFYWVGSYINTYKPTTPFVKDFLKKYVPPTLPQITHVAINSINQKALEDKIHQKALLLPDTFDFNQKKWIIDNYNQDFLKNLGLKENDLILLQATRITKRKGIELAIDFTKELSKVKDKLVGKTLYNGKKITSLTNVVLILAGYAEKDSLDYKELLKEKSEKEKVNVLFVSDLIGAERGGNSKDKLYSLWDAYVFCDLVTFPSLWEGWGNQLIEAIFAKKPIIVFEYPVFKEDISKEGYQVISLGSDVKNTDIQGLVKIPYANMKKAVDKTIDILTNKNTNNFLANNFLNGEKFHSDDFLKKKLLVILKKADEKPY
jgi:mannosylglucosylglycerate synthase